MKKYQNLVLFERCFIDTPFIRQSDIAKPQLGQVDVINGLSLAHWQVNDTENKKDVIYNRLDVHTLSFYMSGGTHRYRKDKPDCKGGQGMICLMPRDSQSIWPIRDSIEFAPLI